MPGPTQFAVGVLGRREQSGKTRQDLQSRTGHRPLYKVVLGYVLAIGGAALTHWAMAVNRFYAPTVRIQADRGHTVVESGSYKRIRHPGNLGNILLNIATPLMLASHWAWIPASVSILLTFVRTLLEDRFLYVELPGYSEFAWRTPSRLLPGVW
jgi:protein-S-isoprenylcysteine O-methyltransferase Ste14